MSDPIDLESYFDRSSLIQAYYKYKDDKTDLFTSAVRIPMGADGVTWEAFEQNLEVNIASMSQRVMNGSYFFYPMREIEVEKPGGGKRPLSIACIRDALVQRQLYSALYESAEGIFSVPRLDNVSFSYRKGKSGPKAARLIWRSFIKDGFSWAFDADIQEFFNSLSHDRLKHLLDDWIGSGTLAGTLLWRFVRTARVPYATYRDEKDYRHFFMHNKPVREARTAGVPQGGVLSGMLANLYLHEFDAWVVQSLATRSHIRYYRYADDFVILTRSEHEARALQEPVRQELESIGLTLHPDPKKTNPAANIASGELEFVGFQFSKDRIRVRGKTIRKFQKRLQCDVLDRIEDSGKRLGILEEHRRLIHQRLNHKVVGPAPEMCEKCGLPKRPYRNWIAYFANTVTDAGQIRKLDHWVRYRVGKRLREKYPGTVPRLRRKHWRLAQARTIESQLFRQRRFSRRFHGEICTCSGVNDSDQ